MAAMNDSLKASVIQKQSKLFFPVEIAVKVILKESLVLRPI